MSALARRVPTAIAYGAFILVPLLAGPTWFAAALALLASLAYIELVRLFAGRPWGPSMPGLVLVLGAFIPRMLVGREITFDLAVVVTGAVAGVTGVRARDRAPRIASLAFTVSGAVYAGWLFGYLVDLARAGSFYTRGGLSEAFPTWLLLALAATWAGDIGAYAVGSAIGRRKLAPRISPGKTWEGTIAGLAAAAAAVVVLGAYAGIPTTSTVIAAVTLGPAALAGDLFESHLKRRAGVKDSGAILPGHGGVLDRIDSLIFVAPVTVVALFVGGTLG